MTSERVGEEHASVLAEMEAHYPPAMRLGVEGLRRKLRRLDRDGSALAWMLREEGHCVAYVLAWVQPSLVDVPDADPVLLIDDLQALPGGNRMYSILRVLAEGLRERGLQRLPLEAACRRQAWRVLEEHAPVVERLGYELRATSAYWDEALGEELCWGRWHPLGEDAGSRPIPSWEAGLSGADPQDSWSSSPGEEVDGGPEALRHAAAVSWRPKGLARKDPTGACRFKVRQLPRS